MELICELIENCPTLKTLEAAAKVGAQEVHHDHVWSKQTAGELLTDTLGLLKERFCDTSKVPPESIVDSKGKQITDVYTRCPTYRMLKQSPD